MLVLEFKTYGRAKQFSAIDEAIQTTQFIRNKALRLWMDGLAKSCADLNKYCAVLAKEFDFADKLNSQARQSAAERAWSAISRFFDNCKKKIAGKKGFPKVPKRLPLSRVQDYWMEGWQTIAKRSPLAINAALAD